MKELKLWFLSEQLITTLTAGETKIFREKVELLQTDRQDIKTRGMYENIYIYIYNFYHFLSNAVSIFPCQTAYL